MGRKKRLLLRYKRLGELGKKFEAKFSAFIKANKEFFTRVEESTPEKAKEAKEENQPTKVKIPQQTPKSKVSKKRTTTAKKKTPMPAKKTATTKRKRRTTKTKQTT